MASIPPHLLSHVIPGGTGPLGLSPDMEEVFDKVHPQHAGHTKIPKPIRGLMYSAQCVPCAVMMYVSLASVLVHSKKKLTEDELKARALADTIEFKVVKDDRYPHDCPRCKGPAYIGGNNNVDCKARCT